MSEIGPDSNDLQSNLNLAWNVCFYGKSVTNERYYFREQKKKQGKFKEAREY